MKVRLSTLLAGLVLAGHAVLLPTVFLFISRLAEVSQQDRFVETARIVVRMAATQAALGDTLDNHDQVVGLLNSIMRTGEGLYADLLGPHGAVRSTINDPSIRFPPQEDQGFDEHGDHVFFYKTAFVRGGATYELRVAFDERPILRRIADIRRRILVIMLLYAAISLSATLALGWWLSAPVRKLRATAQDISRNPGGQSLVLHSAVREFEELSSALELMRQELTLASARLRQQERIETVGRLAGGIAHEFNNTLVPITLLTEKALAEQGEGSGAQRDLQTVMTAARRARDVVKQILIFSREIEEVQLEPLALDASVRESMSLFRPLLPPDVKVHLELGAGLPLVMANHQLVHQLLTNLWANALQSLDNGRGQIEVRLRLLEEELAASGDATQGASVQLSVQDTGRGMDPATQAHLFEPFFSTRPIGEGTGLGLSVVHGIVTKLGARIVVESVQGRGSVFRVIFPIHHPA